MGDWSRNKTWSQNLVTRTISNAPLSYQCWDPFNIVGICPTKSYESSLNSGQVFWFFRTLKINIVEFWISDIGGK